MKISVIIPSYNTRDFIKNTLLHLVEQNIDVEYEIIIVDCSEYKQVEQIVGNIKQSFANIRYIYRQERFNPGEGRNIGAHESKGELLVFIDADVILDPNSLQTAWRHFREGNKIFGGALELNIHESKGLAAYLEHFFFNHESQKGHPPCERKNLSSALMCFEREVFINKGGFRDIPRMQDTELTERLRGEGYHLYFFPDVIAFQRQDSNLFNVMKKVYINGQNIYYIRYRDSISPLKKVVFLAVLPLLSVSKVIRIIGRHLLYQTPGGRIVTLFISIPLTLTGCFWMAGFYNALVTEKGISNNR